jgi:hypothetical protein
MIRFGRRPRRNGWIWTNCRVSLWSRTIIVGRASALPNVRLHATFHVIVENQAALGDETPAAKTLERLMNEGVDRHEAIHAVAAVLSDHINEVLRGSSLPSDPNVPYYAALEKLTVESWRRDYGVPSPSRRAKRLRKSPHR